MRAFILLVLVISYVHCGKRSVSDLRVSASDSTRNPTGSSGATGSGSVNPTGTGSASPSPAASTSKGPTGAGSSIIVATGSSSSGQTTPRTTRATSTASPYLSCYTCGYLGVPACPEPFPYGGGTIPMARALKPAFCAKVVPGSGAQNPIIRRVAVGTECTYNGCRSIGGNTDLCCCNTRDGCNGGLLSSKATVALILSALASLFLLYQF